MACLEVLGVEVLVLEARYVDDYQIMWKSDPSLPFALMHIIGDIVKAFVLRRYPLLVPLGKQEVPSRDCKAGFRQTSAAKILSDTIGVLSSWHDFPQQ